ncbi:ABC transporter ATP-binding protein [Amycolatopsis acidicola]|uniref:ABC transporter ATP-binding protein n=1 Tax=Amycolatopsis acidicola TaxID=2596893 RepID=A0A5N0V2E1_9PSEU|nr:ABC transporter ATP-binding protein [Amycolatopsis acidicola]KAA9158882.1 ABC transporter ATP-binding protein [Amycolatopsis acidicola]
MTRTTYSPAVRLREVSKTYGAGAGQVTALDHVSFDFAPHRFTAVMGPSGSGKSSLLHCAAGLDRPTSGSVSIDGTDLGELDETALTKFRRERVGFVFQALNLLPTLTIEQNVTLPGDLAGRRRKHRAAEQLLARLGLGDRIGRRPDQLSGGQQQRVAIARALLADPAVIFADEPTGALDVRAAAKVMLLLRDSVSNSGQTVVLVTHDPVAAYADEVVFVADGTIVDTMDRPDAGRVAARLADLRPRAGVR